MICISIRLFIFLCLLGQMDVIHCLGQEDAVDDPLRGKSISRAQTVFFEEEIRPVLANHCFRCHADKKQENDLRLDSRAMMLLGGDAGPAILPGQPHQSLLIEVLRREEDSMPPGKRLRPSEISAFEKWVAMGAPWPATKLGNRGKSKFTEADRSYWAFQPLSDGEVPSKQADDHWSRNEIDRFVLRNFQAGDVQPAESATKRVLMRRLYFDMVGVPPSLTEQSAFLDDPDDKAYEKMVDRLLEDPRYGEKWGRHWLDLVRYAESDGYKQDDYRPHAWRYRDYVIEAFNDDKPYDQFILQQLAGDELTDGNPENLVATGYLRHWIYEYNQRDVRTQWDTILNDLTNVTGDVFLAMGMNCARCHDHKFDPILQRDYFRLKAFFTPLLPRDDVPLATPSQRKDFESRRLQYEQKIGDLRERLAALESPYHEKKMLPEIEKFPLDIRPMMKKAIIDRTPFEVQLADLAFRQVKKLTVDELKKRIKGEDLERWNTLREKLAQFDSEKPQPLPVVLTATDAGPVAPPTLMPGDPTKASIEPGVLLVIDPDAMEGTPDRQSSNTTGRRLALARWMTDSGNSLTTRVIVNRVWQYHFGKGIVATASDFGRLGEQPADPALLDWLTRRFIDNQWKFKPLHRLILNSSTYRQAAVGNPGSDFRSFRHVVRRLNAEQIRDSMLSISGELNPQMGGPSSEWTGFRRTIYNKVIRNRRNPLLDVFDAPDHFNSLAKRNVTTTPNQSLLMINGGWALKRAEALAIALAKLSTVEEQVVEAYRLAYCRLPESDEKTAAIQFLNGSKLASDLPSGGQTEESTLTGNSELVDFCHVLFNSSEFLYID